MNNREAGEQVTAKQGLLLLLAAVLVIVVCKIVLSVDTKNYIDAFRCDRWNHLHDLGLQVGGC